MSKIITKIELEGKNIGSKPLLANDTLSSIRDKIKEKTKNINYQFLDNDGNKVEIEDENDYKLSDIIKDKKIKIVSLGNQGSIKVFINDKEFGLKNILPTQKLDEVRNLLKNEINQDFNFLDSDGNDIDIPDEKEYPVEEILKDNAIYLKSEQIKSNDIKASPAPNPYSDSIPKEKPSKNKIKFDLSKYEEVSSNVFEVNILKLYKYSQEKPIQKSEKVYEYYFDEFDLNDYKEAYVVLFCGKSGDGKSTAINAFFNVIKGVQLEDKFRFILISEEGKDSDQSKSITKGVHLYYVKDYNNKPVIIIDSQGYGDVGGVKEDATITPAFGYVFKNIVDHINCAGFIAQAIKSRLDPLTKYIFTCVTSLFSEDISENFIILATFANKDTIKNGPAFINSMIKDEDFLKINKRMDKNYWYAFDSKSIFDDDFDDKLCKYSYEQLSKLYEEKIKRLEPKSIKASGEIINNRETVKKELNNLNTLFKDLQVEFDNLREKERVITEKNLQLKDFQNEIKILENNDNHLNPKEYEEALKQFNDNFEKKLNAINKKTRIDKKKVLVADADNRYTYCGLCKENCHNPCDCWFAATTRCKIYPVFWSECERCGHPKKVHKQENFHYIYEEVEVAENTEKEKGELTEEKERENAKLNERIKKLNQEKNSLKRKLAELNFHKEDLIETINKLIEEKKEMEKELNLTNQKMKITMMKLQSLSEQIESKIMIKGHTRRQNDYIDNLEGQLRELGYSEEKIRERLGNIKENNQLLNSVINIPPEELLLSNANDLMEKYVKNNNNVK